MPKGSDLMVAALENEGVDRIFGVPGEENLDVVESLRNSSIKLVLTRHEQGAAFMAATYGRLTGKPGVCITTLGPGALNLTTGAITAGSSFSSLSSSGSAADGINLNSITGGVNLGNVNVANAATTGLALVTYSATITAGMTLLPSRCGETRRPSRTNITICANHVATSRNVTTELCARVGRLPMMMPAR